MQHEIRGTNIPVSPEVRDLIERRLHFALSRFSRRIRYVTARVSDINGPKGGVDKRCRIVVNLSPSGSIVVEDTHAELSQAITRAADRLGHFVGRHLDRGLQGNEPRPWREEM